MKSFLNADLFKAICSIQKDFLKSFSVIDVCTHLLTAEQNELLRFLS